MFFIPTRGYFVTEYVYIIEIEGYYWDILRKEKRAINNELLEATTSSSNDTSFSYKNGWRVRLWVQNPLSVCNLPFKKKKKNWKEIKAHSIQEHYLILCWISLLLKAIIKIKSSNCLPLLFCFQYFDAFQPYDKGCRLVRWPNSFLLFPENYSSILFESSLSKAWSKYWDIKFVLVANPRNTRKTLNDM